MFTTYPAYPEFRTLRLTTPHQKGEDVFALQRALLGLGYRLPISGADGDFGRETQDALTTAQAAYGLVVDGLAGGATQRTLALRLGASVDHRYALPIGALRGQLEHESGFRLGRYSVIYPDGSYDAGVAQLNTHRVEPATAFDPPVAIDLLGRDIREHYDLFAGVATNRRRWELAQGAWNRPAYACYIAREEGARGVPVSSTRKPTDEQRAALEAYIDSASAYLVA